MHIFKRSRTFKISSFTKFPVRSPVKYSTLLILSLDHNVYEIKLAWENETGGDGTDTDAGVAPEGLDDLLQLQASVMNICEHTRELSREACHLMLYNFQNKIRCRSS